MQFMWQASGTTRTSQIDTTSHFTEALGTHLVLDYSFRTCQNLWSIKLVLECSVSHSHAHENRCIKCGSFHRTAKADTAKKPNSTIATVQKKFAKPGKDTLAKKRVKFCSAYYDCAKRMILWRQPPLTIGLQSSLQQRSVDVFLQDGTYLHATLENFSQQKVVIQHGKAARKDTVRAS